MALPDRRSPPALPDAERRFLRDVVLASMVEDARRPATMGFPTRDRPARGLPSGGLARPARRRTPRGRPWTAPGWREWLEPWAATELGTPVDRVPVSSTSRPLPDTGDTLLRPPAGWRAATDCASRIRGSARVCRVEESSRSWTEVLRGLDLHAAAEALRIRHATAEEEALLLHAWAVLQDNVDLARWAVCWVTGRADAWGCLTMRIRGERRTTIRLRDTREYAFSSGPFGIWIGRGRDGWQNYLFGWTRGSRDRCGLERVDAACQVLDLACTLLHETIHVCGWAWYDESGSCDRSYLVENIFRWALMRRYYSVGRSACCAPFVSRDPMTGRDRGEGADKGDFLFGDDKYRYAHRCLESARKECE